MGVVKTEALPKRVVKSPPPAENSTNTSSSNLRLQKRDRFDSTLELEEVCLDDVPSLPSSCSSPDSETSDQDLVEEEEAEPIRLLPDVQPEPQPTGFIKAFLDS